MMTEPEERILHQDAEEVKQAVESMQEMKIYQAMERGVISGKKQRQQRSLRTGIMGAVSAVAAILLILAWIQAPAQTADRAVRSASPGKAWADAAHYQTAGTRDRLLANALDQKLIQPVYRSAEKAGLRMEILGTVNDGRKLYILYSVHNNTAETVIHADFSLEFGTEVAASIGASLEIGAEDSQIRAGQTAYFYYINNLSPEKDYPDPAKYSVILTQTSDEALQSSSNKYRTVLDVTFKLNPDMLKSQSQTWAGKQELTVAGQKLRVKQALITPLAAYVDVETEEQNTKQVFGLINPVLIGSSGGKTVKSYYPTVLTMNNSELYSDRSQFMLVYAGNRAAKLDTLSLKTFGLSAVEKDQLKVSVDLNRKQIVDAPEGLAAEKSSSVFEEGQIAFHHVMKTDQPQDIFTMRLADDYVDADGEVHERPKDSPNSVQELSRGKTDAEEKYFYDFGAEAADYPQPLTIQIERYWNPVLDTQSVELFQK